MVGPAAHGDRLVDHVREHLAVVATREIGPLIARGAVRIDGRVGRIADPVQAGEVLRVDRTAIHELRARGRVSEPADRPLEVHHEDPDLLVVCKPAGVHVHPMGRYRDDTLLGAVLWYAGARPDRPWAAWRPYPAHRLDRATSGLLAFAKSRAVQDAFRRLLDARAVERIYRAEVHGRVVEDRGTVDLPLGRDPQRGYRREVVPVEHGGQPAITHWRVLRRDTDRTVLEVVLETGRTHQIRAHLAAIGHPVLGDTLYRGPAAEASSAPCIALEAVRLTFPHPCSSEPVDVRVRCRAPEQGGAEPVRTITSRGQRSVRLDDVQ